VTLKLMSEALDGNSIGGPLIDVFGAGMTAANSMCGTCDAVRQVAELVVYQRATGIVVHAGPAAARRAWRDSDPELRGPWPAPAPGAPCE
jgi:uncharacterized protein DUF6510